ncbi:MAG: hypothetical protein ACI4LA_02140, partial [Emergencia sp.]
MKKKIFSILMAVLLVCCFIPAASFADDDPVAKIGNTVYDTLDEAVAAAEDGSVIELLRDCTTEGMNLSKNLTVQAAEGVEDPVVKFTKYGIALWGKSLTFK